jgi:glucan 1,3-beta-glucosidase
MDRQLRSASFVAAVVLTVGLAFGSWWWFGRPVSVVDVPGGRFGCLSYSPATGDASPLTAVDGVYPIPSGRIAADLATLRQYTDCVRTYSTIGPQGDVLALAEAAGMQVLAGIWIGADDERNALEIDRTLALAHAHPRTVRAIVVGNEVLLRREMTGARLARIIDSVKARTELPVTYADIFEFWRRNPVVAESVDLVTIHVLPYWDDPSPVAIDAVQAHVRGIVVQARAAFPGKPMQIGEIGWPSAGRTRAGAAPTLVNEARFVREFAAQAAAIGLPYNLIEAIDQPWKRVPEGTVGGYWGILDADRGLKFPLSGPVREWPEWRRAAGITAALAVGLLVVLAWRVPRVAWWRWPLLGMAASAGATTLWMLVAHLWAIAIGWTGALWSAFLVALAIAGGGLLLTLLAGSAIPRPAASATLAGMLRRRRAMPAEWLGLLQWAVMASAAVIALSLAVDGRHRDFLQLAYWLPGAAFAALAWRQRAGRAGALRPAEGWIAAILIGAAPFCVDASANREALVWAATCWLLAAPWAGDAWRELRAEIGALSAARRGK